MPQCPAATCLQIKKLQLNYLREPRPVRTEGAAEIGLCHGVTD